MQPNVYAYLEMIADRKTALKFGDPSLFCRALAERQYADSA